MTSNCNYFINTHVGTLGKDKAGNTLDLNVVQWYRNPPKFDLRAWTVDNSPTGKSGITLTLSQLRELKEVLNSIDLDCVSDSQPFVGIPLQSNSDLTDARLQAFTQRKSNIPTQTSTTVQAFPPSQTQSQQTPSLSCKPPLPW